MRICLMVEGQESVTWDDWVALAASVRAERARGPLPLGPLLVGVRRRGARLARRVGDDHRARAPSRAHPARHDGVACDVPAPVRARQGGLHGRPRVGRAHRARSRCRLERGRAPGLRVPVLRRADAHPTLRRAARDHPPAVDGGLVLVLGRALHARELQRAAAPRADAAPAADRRRRREARHRRAGRALRRRVQHDLRDAPTRCASGAPACVEGLRGAPGATPRA